MLPPGQREANNAAITAAVLAVFQEQCGFYGSPRQQQLRAADQSIGHHRIA
jgi:hypothetical protein